MRSVEERRTRWEDIVQRDALQILGLWGWRGQAGDARAQEGAEASYVDGISYMTVSFGMFVYSEVLQLQLNITKAFLLVVSAHCKIFFQNAEFYQGVWFLVLLLCVTLRNKILAEKCKFYRYIMYFILTLVHLKGVKGKGKVTPLQAWLCP